jgi:hypothetical protein
MREPIDYHKLNEVFNKFANKEVLVDRSLFEMRDENKRRRSVWADHISTDDTVVAELQKAIEDMGLSVRVLINDELPKTFDWMPHRINVKVNNYANDGKFRIKRDFRIG